MFTPSVNCEINVVMTNGTALVQNWRFIFKFKTLKNQKGTNSMEQSRQLVRSFSPCRLIFVFTRVCNGSCLNPLEYSAHLISIFFKILLVLFSHLYVGLPSNFIIKHLCEFLIFPTNGKCQICLVSIWLHHLPNMWKRILIKICIYLCPLVISSLVRPNILF